MGKSKAPAPPDYAALATAQGAANVEAANQTAALNRPNQVDSNGSQTWSLKPGADPKNPQAGDWTVTTSLNATQQALKDQQDALSGQYAGLAQGALGTIGNTMATKFDTSGLPQASQLTKDGLSQFGTTPQAAYGQMANTNGVQGQMISAPTTQRAGVGTDNLQSYGQVGQSTAQTRQQIADALMSQQNNYLQPAHQQADSDLTSRLAAQGITAGSEAYNREVDNQARQQASENQQARNAAILAGGNEESRINQMNLGNAQFDNSTRQQQLDERLGVAGFNNGNIDSQFAQGLAATQANNAQMNAQYGQSLAGIQANNSQLNSQFGQGLSAAQVANANRAQQFNENQSINSANNTLHTNAVQEALMQRELGMNEANALRTGNQVGTPQFQAYGGAGQVQAAPIYQSGVDSYNAGLAATNANNAGGSSFLGGLTGVANAGIGAYKAGIFSDPRLKTNIKRIGTHPSGIGVYEYTYLWGEKSKGVMADEVRLVRPDAVTTTSTGYDMVDYSKLEH